ncbi:MAG: MG2 domain-containing protein [Bacteroidota bacterium]
MNIRPHKRAWLSLPILATMALLLFTGGKSYSPIRMNGFLEELLSQLSAFSQTHTDDRVYVKTDKPLYKPGETIWFSAFLRDGKDFSPSGTSDILKVELLNPKGGLQDNYQVIAQEGMAKGDFHLPEGAPGGI